MPESELLRFLAQVRADPALRQMIAGGLTADEVSLLAQERGFLVSGSNILRFDGQPGASSPRVRSRWTPVGGAGVDVKARRVKDAMSSFLIRRDDGINDGIAGQVFDSYEAAYAVVERYYADICCSDDREYYRIVDASEESVNDDQVADYSSLNLG